MGNSNKFDNIINKLLSRNEKNFFTLMIIILHVILLNKKKIIIKFKKNFFSHVEVNTT